MAAPSSAYQTEKYNLRSKTSLQIARYTGNHNSIANAKANFHLDYVYALRKSGGDWGFIDPKECFAEPAVAALEALKPGEHSGILALNDWRLIIQKAEAKAGKTPALEDIWPQVEAAARNELAQARYDAWIEGLRQKAYIKNMDVKLQ